MNNIFNTDDLSDLPQELIKELNLASEVDNKLLALFEEAGGTLNLTKLLVGYYRKYGASKTRQYMMTTCYRLVKKGFLCPTDNKGEYKITEKGKAVANRNSDLQEESTERISRESEQIERDIFL